MILEKVLVEIALFLLFSGIAVMVLVVLSVLFDLNSVFCG